MREKEWDKDRGNIIQEEQKGTDTYIVAVIEKRLCTTHTGSEGIRVSIATLAIYIKV